MVNGLVARPRSIPNVPVFYGISSIAALGRDRQQQKLGFHLTFASVKKYLLDCAVGAPLISAVRLHEYMTARATLAEAEGLLHQEEAVDHDLWVTNLGGVSDDAEADLNAATTAHGCSAQQLRAAWVDIMGVVLEFKDFRHTKQFL